MNALPPLTVADLASGWADDLVTASGVISVWLDDGRCLQTRHGDLLSTVADLAQRRPVLDLECVLMLDPLVHPQLPGAVVLQLRLGSDGDEIGVRHTTTAELDRALTAAWQQVQHHAEQTHDRALLEELLIPHAEHYWPLARALA